MGRLIELAAWLLIESGGGGSARAATIRMTAVALCAGLVAALMLAALGCVATALWIFTLPSLGPVGAPLVVAAALSTVILVLAMAAWLIMRHSRRRPNPTVVPQLLLSQASQYFNEHKGVVLLAAVVAGMVAANGGRKP
jgi:hypothetical protein